MMATLLGAAAVAAAGSVWWLSPPAVAAYPDSPHYDAASKKFANPQPLRGVTLGDGIGGLLKMAGGESRYAPKARLPMAQPDWSQFLSDDGTHRFIWFGHSTLLMRVGGQTIAVDPIVGRSVSPLRFNMRRFQEPAAPLSEWPTPDVVLISHNHYDHFEEDTLRQFAAAGTHFIVPLGLGAYLKPLGVEDAAITELDWWQSIERAGIRHTLVPAWHTSGRALNDGKRTFWGGHVIEHGGETIYYSGDSAYGTHFAEIGQRFPDIGIAFIENGQYDRRWPDDHMLPASTAQSALDVKARRVVPVHWGAYTMAFHNWDDSVRQSVPIMRERGLQPMTPMQGQVFDVGTETEEWYLKVQ